MSGWDQYIESVVNYAKSSEGDVHIDKVCLIAKDGGAKWTSDTHANSCKANPGETAVIANCFSSGNFTGLMASGVHLEGQKYQFLRESEGRLVFAKCKDKGAYTLQSTKTAIVIAHIPEGKQQGIANKAVDQICTYLESQNM